MCRGRLLGRHLDVLGWSSGDDGRGQGPVRQSVLELVGRTLGCSPLAVIAHQPSKRCDIARLTRSRRCAAQAALPPCRSSQGRGGLLACSPVRHWHWHWHCPDVLVGPVSGRVRALPSVPFCRGRRSTDPGEPPAPAAIGPPHHQASRGDRRSLKLEIRSSLSAHARSPAAELLHCPPCLCLCLCLPLPPVPVRWRLPRGCTARHREDYFSARLGPLTTADTAGCTPSAVPEPPPTHSTPPSHSRLCRHACRRLTATPTLCSPTPWTRQERTQSRPPTRTMSYIRARGAGRYVVVQQRLSAVANSSPDSRGRKGL
jgi:hypothetical protein